MRRLEKLGYEVKLELVLASLMKTHLPQRADSTDAVGLGLCSLSPITLRIALFQGNTFGDDADST